MATQLQETTAEGENEASMESFLKQHNVRNNEATAKALQTIGVTISDLMEWREQDIDEVCKEANIGVMSRADLLKVLRKIPESQVYKDNEAKTKSKTTTTTATTATTATTPATTTPATTTPATTAITSQVIILHPNDHDKMNKLYEEFKKVSKKVSKIESEIIELEDNCKLSKKQITDTCQSIVASIEKHEQYLLQKIDTYKNKKKDLLQQQLQYFQHFEQGLKLKLEQINKCINESNIDMYERRHQLQQLLQDETITYNLSDENEKEVNTNVIVQFTNEKKNIEKLVEMVDQLLKQQMIIVESGSITLSNVKVKEESKISENPLLS
ncbi:myotubularin-related protein, partial [Reticulomyxa filosa]